jgi:DNA-binding transcriptional LysR family regulator
MAIGQVSDIDIRLLRVFKSVVECGGFSAAEGTLNVTRAAIGLSINELEQRLGLRLCQRGRSGFALTAAGRETYEATLSLFVAMDRFRQRVNAAHASLRGELNIGITDNLVTSPHMRMTTALNALHDIAPEVRFNVKMCSPEDVERGVMDGRFHLGAVPDGKRLPGLDYTPLYDEELLLYCGAGHRLFGVLDDARILAGISACDAVVLEQNSLPAALDACRDLKVAATSAGREGIAFLILSGNYVGYLPVHYAARWVEAGQMRALRPQDFAYRTSYCVISRHVPTRHPLAAAYLQKLAEVGIDTPCMTD